MFKRYSVFGSSITGNIILNIINSTSIKLIEELENEINKFDAKAIIIPIDVNSYKDANDFETKIGNYLIENGIDILNSESHKY